MFNLLKCLYIIQHFCYIAIKIYVISSITPIFMNSLELFFQHITDHLLKKIL